MTLLKRAWESKAWNEMNNIKQDCPPIELPSNAAAPEQLYSFDTVIKDMASQQENQEILRYAWPFRDDVIQQRQLASRTLGQPFEALVVTNPNKPRGAPKALPNIGEYVSSLNVPLHWEDAMRERPTVKAEYNSEVFKNIEELRPRHTNVLSRLETEKLVATLMHSFVNEQLAGYIRDKVARTSPKMPYNWIVKETPWKPVESFFWGHITPKQQLALMVVRRSWRIDVLEQIEKLGIAHLWLSPKAFRLITYPTNPLIEAMSTEYCDEAMKEGITQDAKESHLEFHCRKTTLMAILERLDALIKSAKVARVSVAHVNKDELDEPFLKELRRIADAAIEYTPEAKTLQVTWFDDKKQKLGRIQRPQAQAGLDQETPADVALRLITRPGIKPEVNRVQILGLRGRAAATQCHWIEHRRHRRAMSWNEKLWRWLRFTQSVPKEASPETSSIDLPRQVVLSDQSPEANTKNTGLVNSITATFGYVLHQRNSASAVQMARKPRLLFPVVPHPAALTSIRPEQNSVLESAFLIFNFAPDPIHGAAHVGNAPQVRLRVPISPDTDLSKGIPKTALLHAVVPWYVNDVLLPGSSVDIRIVQERLFVLDTRVQLPLKQFVAASKIDLPSSHYKTPARVRILLPKSIASYAKSPVDAMKNANNTLSSSKFTTAVPYIFMDFSKPGEKSDSAVAADFLQAVQDIATGQAFPWHQGHMLMKKPSADQLAALMYGNEDGAKLVPDETQHGQIDNANGMGQLRAVQCVDEKETIQYEQQPRHDQGAKDGRGLRNGGQGGDYQENDQELEKDQDGEEEEEEEEEDDDDDDDDGEGDADEDEDLDDIEEELIKELGFLQG
ncbi:hypothetical protein CDD82_4006 [Ophiocordyceps australis]|uniref:Uncharacterized protein n=1 Tax=Ophiocordyceps australis TaxID=1399860 RepID=A0A2C5YE98_9HYPO|nr:hypothetical protein CDD82_4006 [Ophiocordyceps australis]